MPHAIRRVDIAGRYAVTSHCHSHRLILFCRDVTDQLQILLRKSGHNLHTTAEREVVRTIKEKCCYIASNPVKEEKEAAGRTEEFRLPDGSAVQLGTERFKAPEILFNPEQVGLEYAGVHQVVVDSINRVDLDLRKSLFSNVVLSGGSTLCRGATPLDRSSDYND
jgi:centractin